MRSACLALILLLPTLRVAAAPADDLWMSVLLDGRKIGHMHTTREVRDGSVLTTQKLEVELERAGVKVALSTGETDAETPAGEPLAFSTRSTISGIASTVQGTRRSDGRFDVVSEVGGAKTTRVVDWPKGALLAEGMRLAELRAGLAPGTRFTEPAFQADSLAAVQVESTVGPREDIALPDGSRTLLTRVDQVIHLPGAPTRSQSWVDADGIVRKTTLPLIGLDLTMLACSQACASAPNQGTDILVRMIARAPAALTPRELRDGVVIDIRARAGAAPLAFAQTGEQRVRATANGVELRITPLGNDASHGAEAPPTPADSQPTDWLQSDAPEIRKLAREGAGDAKTPAAQMLALQEFVRRFIRNKDLNVGYASALEVAKNPEGDCTEHAVLLAALGRALDIPTRVVDGLAYTDRYAGIDHVFVPHAWSQAWIDGRWRSFDSALPGFDAGHIALSAGDGDPWRFFSGMDTLGRMQVESVAPLPRATLPAPN
ncbi:MAG: transglutaminase domain-containing protein [Proteobacteria bacterium]|nr:transglutaminase domain-containing protein [Pseudomonadota bacterium]